MLIKHKTIWTPDNSYTSEMDIDQVVAEIKAIAGKKIPL